MQALRIKSITLSQSFVFLDFQAFAIQRWPSLRFGFGSGCFLLGLVLVAPEFPFVIF